MNKTKIEWADYTSNPVKGYCPMACPYCYARAMYDRFGWDKTIRFDINALWNLPGKPSRIFVGSTIELFGKWVLDEWMRQIIKVVDTNPQHTFQFLTKCPENLVKWNPWPENAQVGVTATDTATYQEACVYLARVEARVRFISFEPLLGAVYTPMLNHMPRYVLRNGLPFDWLIIGAQTNPYKPPREEWVQEIIEAADEAGVPVFLKDNLKWHYERKEWPKGGKQ